MDLGLAELKDLLKTTGLEVAYSHFKEKMPLPSICYLVTDVTPFYADDRVYMETFDVDIELYTVDKEITIEEQIKTILGEQELEWEYNEDYLEDEKVYMCTFSITLKNMR